MLLPNLDTKTSIVEDKNLKRGDIIRISGATTKLGYQDKIELTLGSHGTISVEQNPDANDMPEVKVAPTMEIKNIKDSDSDITIEAKIVEKQDVYEFEKDGKKGAVCGIQVADASGQIRVVFWNEQTSLLNAFDVNSAVRITGLRPSVNKYDTVELVFSGYSSIKLLENQKKFGDVTGSTMTGQKSLSEITPDMRSVDVIAKIIDVGEIREFSKQDNTQGKVANIVIQDDTQSMRVVLWNEHTDNLSGVEAGSFVKIKNARPGVSNFSGELELSLNNYSTFEILEDAPDFMEFEQQDILLSQIDTPKSGVNLKLQITNIFEPREITRQDGTTSMVQNASVYDSEGNSGRIAAWDDNIDQLVGIEKGSTVEVINVRVKPGKEEYGPEVVLNKSSQINVLEGSEELFIPANKLTSGQHFEKTTISDIVEQNRTSGKVEVQGTIVKSFKPSFYDGCNQCGRKVTKDDELSLEGICEIHGSVPIENKIVLTVVLDDEQQNIPATFFNKQVEKLMGMSAAEAKDMIKRLSDDMAPISSSNIVFKELVVRADLSVDRENQTKLSIISFAYPNEDEEIDQLLNELS